MSGSRPLPEAVTRSTGISCVLPGSAAWRASTRALTWSARARGYSARDWILKMHRHCTGTGDVADRRPQKYCGDENGCPIWDEPATCAVMDKKIPVCLDREDDLCDTGDNKRVNDAHDKRKQEKDQYRRFCLFFDQGSDRFGSHEMTASCAVPSGVFSQTGSCVYDASKVIV